MSAFLDEKQISYMVGKVIRCPVETTQSTTTETVGIVQ